MQYYISKTQVSLDAEGRLSAREVVLTKPSTIAAAQEAHRRYTVLGIGNIHICEHPKNSRRWGRLDREATARRKTRPLTIADVVEDLAELERESQENKAS
jgi:hypothetical protein